MKIQVSNKAAEQAGLSLSKDGLYDAPRREKPKNFSDDLFTLNPEVKNGVLHLYLNDEIDQWWGIGPEHLSNALREVGDDDPVMLHVNSPGGSVFDAVAMAALIQGREVTARVEGLAASAATFLVMSAKNREITNMSQLMVHSAWTTAAGNATELEYTAKLLRAIDKDIADMYAERSSLDLEGVTELMEAETYMSADEALENGFVDKVVSLTPPKETPDNQGKARARSAAMLALRLRIAA